MAALEAQKESEKLLTIFPKEIWMLTFENIFHPEDLHHLKVSSGFFDILLQTQKTKSLFSEIIKILCASLTKSSMSQFGTHVKVSNHLLNCRLVCRTWQIGVDNALQNSSTSSKLFNVAFYSTIYLSGLPSDAHFSLPQQPAVFLQQFGGQYVTNNRNPFIGRSLYIYYRELTTDYESFTQQLLPILTIYGHHIWKFILYVSPFAQQVDHSSIWLCERLRDFLQLMPNLKVFKLSCGAYVSNDEWKALKLSLQSCVFPELKDLAYLQLGLLPTPVFDALLRGYSHVKMLSYPLIGRSDMLMHTYRLPNLTQIAFSLKNMNTLIQWDTSNALWPLKTLIIRLEFSQVDWQFIFQFLENRWAATLTELKIDFCPHPPDDNRPTQVLPSVKLPNLKEFAYASNFLVSFDFILPMRNHLERLFVRFYSNPTGVELERDVENDQEIQFLRFRGNLQRSNIWSLFPNLNTAEYYDRRIGKQLCRRPLSIV